MFKSFNSLYWDFCFASLAEASPTAMEQYGFQFPLLGFLLCISLSPSKLAEIILNRLSIPFIGIFALHRIAKRSKHPKKPSLSIPFIGIFALHHPTMNMARLIKSLTFNSLYWDFCFASVGIFWRVCRFRLFLSLVSICIFDYYLSGIWFIKIIEISLFMAE